MDSRVWPERNPRHSVDLVAEVVHADGRVTTATVNNLSAEGCGVTGTFRIGERVTVALPDIGTICGQVRWAFNGAAGVQFDDSSPPATDG